MRMRKLLYGILAASLAFTPSHAADDDTKALVYDRELDSTSLQYCALYADTADKDFWGLGILQDQRVTTSGSSTTVTAVVSTEAPFDNLAAGDEMIFNLDGVTEKRYVSAVASDISMTVNAAINLGDGKQGAAGYGFYFRNLSCGTAATSGWINNRPGQCATVIVDVDQMNATSIDSQLECRHLGAVSPNVTLASKNFTAAGSYTFSTCNYVVSGAIVANPVHCDEFRVGLKINTDDGDDLTTNAEKITITASSMMR